MAGSAQDPLSLNRYLYAEANPITLIDPDGHMAVRVSGGRVHLDQQRAYYTAKAQQTLRRTAGTQRTASLLVDNRHVGAQKKDEGLLGVLHTGLDFAGFIPVVGIGADLVNGGLYAAQGDWVNAGLATVSAIPIAGDALGAGKLALKYGDEAVAVAGHADEAFNLVSHYGDNVVAEAGHFGDEALEGAASCLHSFRGDTPVWTPGGRVPIAALAVGASVFAFDTDSGTVGTYTVTASMVHADPAVTTVVINGDTVETTPTHPFDTDHGWIQAGELRPGDRAYGLRGWGTVDAVTTTAEPAAMYDLTVAGAHTFFVGDGWLVHNACGLDDWAQLSGTLRDAAAGKGNFGLGTLTDEQARALGDAWVGSGSRVSRTNPNVFVSADSLRQFRLPNLKPTMGEIQANLEWRNVPSGNWVGNGHVTIR